MFSSYTAIRRQQSGSWREESEEAVSMAEDREKTGVSVRDRDSRENGSVEELTSRHRTV